MAININCKLKTNYSKPNSTILICSLVLIFTFISSRSWAHDTWIKVEKSELSQPAMGNFSVSSGHKFPADNQELVEVEGLNYDVYFVTPAGRKMPALPIKEGSYGRHSALTESGTYIAVVQPKKDLFTKISQRYLREPFQKYAKAIFTVGQPDGDAFTKSLGHTMEIIPLVNPSNLKTGDILPVKVMREGIAVKKKVVFGTYSGFSDAPNTFAYTTRTNNDGIAQIKIIHDGTWLLIVKHRKGYQNQSGYERLDWRASLTFTIR